MPFSAVSRLLSPEFGTSGVKTGYHRGISGLIHSPVTEAISAAKVALPPEIRQYKVRGSAVIIHNQ